MSKTDNMSTSVIGVLKRGKLKASTYSKIDSVCVAFLRNTKTDHIILLILSVFDDENAISYNFS